MKHIPLFGGNNIAGIGGHGSLDSYWVLIVPNLSSRVSIFPPPQPIRAIPAQLTAAARPSAAGRFRRYRKFTPPLSHPAPPPPLPPTGNTTIGFDARGGDAFAWTERVSGTARCHVEAISVNGHDSGAKIERKGQEFGATLTLSPGRNVVVAACAASGNGTESS